MDFGVAASLRRFTEERISHAGRLPAITTPNRVILEALEEGGVYRTTLADFPTPLNERMFESARGLIERTEGRVPHDALKSVLLRETLRHPDVFLWGAQERVLDLVERYLGVPVAYRGPKLGSSPVDGAETGTRLWHRDPEDHRLVKICVYLNDVDSQTGPLEYIPGRRDMSELMLDLDPLSNARVPDFAQRVECIGPQRTVVFFDPHAVVHRGKPPTARPRWTVFYAFHSRSPVARFARHWFTNYDLHDLTRVTGATTLSERQRAAIFWWCGLPPDLRPLVKSDTTNAGGR